MRGQGKEVTSIEMQRKSYELLRNTGQRKAMEWRRTVELSEGMVQRANEPECYGKESQVGAKEMKCGGLIRR